MDRVEVCASGLRRAQVRTTIHGHRSYTVDGDRLDAGASSSFKRRLRRRNGCSSHGGRSAAGAFYYGRDVTPLSDLPTITGRTKSPSTRPCSTRPCRRTSGRRLDVGAERGQGRSVRPDLAGSSCPRRGADQGRGAGVGAGPSAARRLVWRWPEGTPPSTSRRSPALFRDRILIRFAYAQYRHRVRLQAMQEVDRHHRPQCPLDVRVDVSAEVARPLATALQSRVPVVSEGDRMAATTMTISREAARILRSSTVLEISTKRWRTRSGGPSG